MEVGLHFLLLVDEEHLFPPEAPTAADAGAAASEAVQVRAPMKMFGADVQDEARVELCCVFIDGGPGRSLPVR